MKALVIFEKTVARAAEAVAQGLKEAGMEFDSVDASAAPATEAYSLVFIGASAGMTGVGKEAAALLGKNNWAGKSVALFFVVDSFGKKALESAAVGLAARGAFVKGTIGLRRGGFLGLGALLEIELARAQAFGERTANSVRGIRVRKAQEKARIRFYKK